MTEKLMEQKKMENMNEQRLLEENRVYLKKRIKELRRKLFKHKVNIVILWINMWIARVRVGISTFIMNVALHMLNKKERVIAFRTIRDEYNKIECDAIFDADIANMV